MGVRDILTKGACKFQSFIPNTPATDLLQLICRLVCFDPRKT